MVIAWALCVWTPRRAPMSAGTSLRGLFNALVLGWAAALAAAILLGAPFSAATASWGVLQAAAAVMPALWTDAVSGGHLHWAWPCALSACGSWLGAIAAPLDWDEPWQPWPVPSSVLCTLGALAGLLAALLAGRCSGRKLQPTDRT